MKRMLLAAFSALCLSVSAQITVTSATFPVVGDTLHFAYDESPNIVNPAPMAGAAQFWDFAGLHADETDLFIYRAAITGMNSLDFPNAELVLTGSAGGETYYNVTNTKMEVLGYAGQDPVGVGLEVTTPLSPALIERRSPLSFSEAHNQETFVSLSFSTDQPPLSTIFANFPVNVDSLRVKVTTRRQEQVDGWGTCKIPGGQYPVLRQKRSDLVTTNLEVYVLLFPGFGSWVDVSNIPGASGFGDFIGTDTTTTFRFISGTEKEEIAVATMSNDLNNVERVRYKSNAVTTAAPEVSAIANAGISAFPNPAIDWVRFDCINLPQDDYTLKIFNIIGKVVWKENYQLAGNRSFRVDLDDFKKGTYLYSLSDKKGNVIGTKRLVVLKP